MPKPAKKAIPEVSELLQGGPSTSTAIGKQLEAAGLSPTAARQRISRAGPPVERLPDIYLPHRGQILFLSHHRGTPGFVHGIAQLLAGSRSTYGLALRSLNSRGGSVPLSLFNTISGCPTRLKKQIGSERVLSTLVKVGLATRTTVTGLGEVVCSAGANPNNSSSTINQLKARLKAEQIVLCGLRDWLRKLGMVSYDAVEIRGDTNRKHFGQFEWDLTAPSYVHPMVRQDESGRLVSGFFVADVFLGEDLTASSIDYFVNKFDTMRSRRTTRPFMAMLLADRFDKDAFKEHKPSGILLATVENVFGSDVAEALRSLVKVLSDAAIAIATEPEKLDKMLSALSRIEGAALNVRSDLFEVVVGYCVKEVTGAWVDLRLNITDPTTGERAEIDVLSKKRESVHVVECKGIRSDKKVEKYEVEEWLTKKVPRIHRYLTHGFASTGQAVEFSMWTTGGFAEDAVEYLRERKDATQKYGISWKDRAALEQFLREKKLSNIRQIIDNHFTADR